MLRRHKRLLVLTQLVLIAAFWWGCTQPEDILTEKSTTVINLVAERLPTTPDGMAYQLWAADTIIADAVVGSVPLGQPFRYDFRTNRYLELDGTQRADTNEFRFAGDILNFQWVFIAVQLVDGTGPSPGPVMLIDSVTPDGVSNLDMIFPFSDSLWNSAIEFNMETPSDGRNPVTDGAAVWFSVYDELTYSVQDTIDLPLDSIFIVTVYVDTFTPADGRCVTSIVNIFDPIVKDTQKIVGFDTVTYKVVRYSQETVEVCDSGQGNLLKTTIELGFITLPARTGRYDAFTQVAIDLPDLRPMGWLYQGWVVSSVIRDLEGVGVGEFTPPAWVGFNKHDSVIRGADGLLLPTGLFHSLYEPDQSNEHVQDPIRVPPYPGEDFLWSFPPNQAYREVNLVPGGEITGTVFISLRPMNALTDTTNFPLIIQVRDLPSTRFDVQDDHQQFIMKPYPHTNSFGMGGREGMPQVQARIRRF